MSEKSKCTNCQRPLDPTFQEILAALDDIDADPFCSVACKHAYLERKESDPV